MMKRVFVFVGIAAATIVSGCASGGVGLAESPMWHATASMEAKVEYFQKKCAAFGHQPGTPGMTECLQSSMQASEGNANARAAIAGGLMQQSQRNLQNQQNQNRPVTCTTYGNTTTCR